MTFNPSSLNINYCWPMNCSASTLLFNCDQLFSYSILDCTKPFGSSLTDEGLDLLLSSYPLVSFVHHWLHSTVTQHLDFASLLIMLSMQL